MSSGKIGVKVLKCIRTASAKLKMWMRIYRTMATKQKIKLLIMH